MRGFTTLVKKEARDHAVSTAVCAVVAALVSWPVQKWVYKYDQTEWTAAGLVPILLGLFLVLLASDLFAADVATRRMESFAVLPVPAGTHWAARATFLALAGAALAAWMVGVNAAILAAMGKNGAVWDFLGHVGASGPEFAWAALFGAGTLFVSATGVGGFRAAFVGSLAAWAVGAAAWTIQTTDPFALFRTGDETFAPALAGCAVLVAGSYVAFVRGRPSATRRAPAFAWGAAPLALLLLPGAAVAGARVRDMLVLTPGAPYVCIRQIEPSPDGRYLALVVYRDDQESTDTSRTWIVRVEDGALFTWSPRGDYYGGWTKEGLFAQWRIDRTAFGPTDDDDCSLSLHSPDTGAVVRTPTKTEWISGSLLVDAYSSSRGRWMGWPAAPGRSIGDWKLERVGAKFEPVYSRGMPVPLVEQDVVVRVTKEGALVRTHLGTRAETVLVPDGIDKTGGAFSFSPDRRFLLVETEAGTRALDATTWKFVAGPWKAPLVSWSMTAAAGARACLSDAKTELFTTVIDVEHGVSTPLPSGVHSGSRSVAPLPDGTVAVVVDEREVVLVAADGKRLRRLYGAEK